MTGEPLSDLIALSGARCTVTRCMEVDGPFHYDFAPPAGIKFIAITHGSCWLSAEGLEERALKNGDVFMLRGDRPFAMATDFALPAVNGNGVFTAASPTETTTPSEFQSICGHVAVDRESGQLLIDILPPVILLNRHSSEAPTTEWLLKQLIREMTGERTGYQLALQQLTQLIFIQVIRTHISARMPSSVGMIAALGDDRIARALRLMHGEPARAWTVRELATRAGLSRTTFATVFSALFGTGPAAYLSSWRMSLAERELRVTSHPITSIAQSVGFTSASAFAAAFRSRFGLSPHRYRKRAEAAKEMSCT